MVSLTHGSGTFIACITSAQLRVYAHFNRSYVNKLIRRRLIASVGPNHTSETEKAAACTDLSGLLPCFALAMALGASHSAASARNRWKLPKVCEKYRANFMKDVLQHRQSLTAGACLMIAWQQDIEARTQWNISAVWASLCYSELEYGSLVQRQIDSNAGLKHTMKHVTQLWTT